MTEREMVALVEKALRTSEQDGRMLALQLALEYGAWIQAGSLLASLRQLSEARDG